jgi:hypothetical protein
MDAAGLDISKTHYAPALVWAIIGISWSAITYSYAGSIIGTTLGQYFL